MTRDPTPLESLASTLRTWTPFDQLHSSPTSPLLDPSTSPTSPRTLHRGNGLADLCEEESASPFVGEDPTALAEDLSAEREGKDKDVLNRGPETGERVAWAGWDAIDGLDGEPRRMLLLAYKSGGFAIWDCSSLDTWFEILNLPHLDSALEDKLSHKLPRGTGPVVGAAVLQSVGADPSGPLVALLTGRPPSATTSHVLLYSLRTHRIVDTLSMPGSAHRILVNRRFLVVSTTAPLALHIHTLVDFRPAPFSPLTDVAPSQFDGTPVFSLGSGGRLLAYATDRLLLSSRLDRSLAKPGAGLLAHSGLFDAGSPSSLDDFGGDRSRFMTDAGQVGGEVARRVGEGVMSGVKAIGEAGLSYWMTRGGGRGGEGRDGREANDGAARTFSKSAPLPSMAGIGRRLSITTAKPTQPDSPSSSLDSSTSTAAGTVIVVDLLSHSASKSRARGATTSTTQSLKTVAHFRPYHQSLALISLSPSSTMLLTASSQAHFFDVFELKPSVSIGLNATSAVPSAAGTNHGKVWHRYRLQRGFTTAQAASATWSPDGRFVAVGTGKGTTHVYAVQPTGGKPQIDKHFVPKVANMQELPPLSVVLSTIARIRPVAKAHESPVRLESSSTAAGPAFPSVIFLPKSASFQSSFRPAPLAYSSYPSPRHRSSSVKAPPVIQDLLIFHPSSSSSVLHRLTALEIPPPTSAEGAVAAASRGDVGRLATTAVSGLTQLMKSRGGFGGAAGAGPGGEAAQAKRDWTVVAGRKAEWRVARTPGAGEVKEELGEGQRAEVGVAKAGVRYSAYAEIETFSRSPRVLPRSIYQSQQFEFFSLPTHHNSLTSKGTYTLPLRRLEMRSEVQIRQGDGSVSSDMPTPSSPSSFRTNSAAASVPFEPGSFDQPIKTAMQTVLDSEAILAPGSPKLPAPTFPNGLPGKQGSWRDAIPIRSVGPAAMEGIGKVRQGLTRVCAPTGIIGVARSRRASASAVAQTNAAAYSSSISFDDDDAVFADRIGGIDGSESASTACTSEIDEELKDGGAGGKKAANGEVDDWDWDAGDGDERTTTRPTSAPGDISLAGIPFEEDFDDFELELPPPASHSHSPAAIKPTSLVPTSPLGLESLPSPSAPANVAPVPARHLAPPVSVYACQDDASGGSSSSGSLEPTSSLARRENPLFNLDRHIPTALSVSPASSSSASSSTGRKKKRK
ncbi:SPOSA6832_01880 [Sporobolomyces salmonicolor]|uniref:SPOSA6832_01880-mRNA-1:cds n=1 Tax=Sporidiobolus salmonicolor TaxID=5005 RepID=A0A0D6EK47_SPOSA|nr:SPOSA6832_01880 [Sporobolomyces salmonicolor]